MESNTECIIQVLFLLPANLFHISKSRRTFTHFITYIMDYTLLWTIRKVTLLEADYDNHQPVSLFKLVISK